MGKKKYIFQTHVAVKLRSRPLDLSFKFRGISVLSYLCDWPQNHAQIKMYIITTFLPEVLLLTSLFQFKSFILFSKVTLGIFIPNR